jgi:hypothetical protein
MLVVVRTTSGGRIRAHRAPIVERIGDGDSYLSTASAWNEEAGFLATSPSPKPWYGIDRTFIKAGA